MVKLFFHFLQKGNMRMYRVCLQNLNFLKSRPDPGQHADDPDGFAEPGKSENYEASSDPNVGMSFGQACRTGLFWRLTLGFFI